VAGDGCETAGSAGPGVVRVEKRQESSEKPLAEVAEEDGQGAAQAEDTEGVGEARLAAAVVADVDALDEAADDEADGYGPEQVTADDGDRDLQG
jgi:hypothetical protein